MQHALSLVGMDVWSDEVREPEIVTTPTNSFVRIEDDLCKADKKEEDDPVWRHEFREQLKLLWPIVLTFVLEYIPEIVSVVLVGHLDDGNSQRYVDAVTLSNMFMTLTCMSVGFGMTSALDTLVAQAYGANCLKKVGIYLQSGVLVVTACLVPMFALNWFTEPMLRMLGQDPEVAHLSGEFSRIAVFSMPFLLAYEMLRKLLQAQQVVRPMVVIVVVGDAVNILAGYWLTYHTTLGFRGTALALILGYAVLPLSLIGYLLFTNRYQEWWPGWDLREAKRQAALFFRLGMPGLLMLLMEWWSFEMLAILAGLLPQRVVAVSAHAVLVNVSNTLFMAYIGTSVSASIRVGNLLGANKPRHARVVCQISVVLVLITASVLAVLVVVFRYQIPKLLINDSEAIQRAGDLMILFAVFTVIDGADCVLQGIYRGIGRQRVAAWTNGIGYYILGLPTSVLLAFVLHWGVAGLWAGCCLFGSIVTLAVLSTLLCRTDWQVLADEARERTEL